MIRDRTSPRPESLSDRELEVLDLIGRQRTNAQIAEELDISFATAKWHVSQIISKRGVSSREELVEEWRAMHGLRGRFRRFAGVVLGANVLKFTVGGVALVIGATAVASALIVALPGSQPSAGGAPPTVASELKLPAGNVLSVTPADGAVVTQASLIPAAVDRPAGVCADVTFARLDKNFRSFRMTVDGDEVTSRLAIIATGASASNGRLCFSEPEGLPVGRHTAEVLVAQPGDPSGPPMQAVAWSFEVTP